MLQRQLDSHCDELTKTIQNTIKEQVPITEVTLKSKCWWTKELTQLQKEANKLGRQSYKRRSEPEHTIHKEHKKASKIYRDTLEYTKKQHWHDWLERAEDLDIWTVNKLISSAALDGGKARIPVLKGKVGGQETSVNTNDKKSATLAKGFFPPKLQMDEEKQGLKYPQQVKVSCKITMEQIQKQLHKLKPYKAPGPDRILNIILTK